LRGAGCSSVVKNQFDCMVAAKPERAAQGVDVYHKRRPPGDRPPRDDQRAR